MKSVKKFLPFLTAVLGIVAIAMIFVVCVVTQPILTKTTGYTGIQIVFGFKEGSAEVFKFSFLGLLPYILSLGGIVLALLKIKGLEKVLSFVAAGTFIVAAVFFFITPSTVQADEMLLKILDLKLAVGAIVSGVLCILAAFASLASCFLPDAKKKRR